MTILKIIEALQSYSEDVLAYKLDGGFANAVTEAVSLLIGQGEQIADLQNELRDERWIPVTERLPDVFGEYLVTVKDVSGQVYSDYADYDPFRKKWTTGLFLGVRDKITHWMPLPKTPKEEYNE